jgi:transposase-like protein
MQRRRFSREFKIEAVKLVRERGVSAAQAGRDRRGRRSWTKRFESRQMSRDGHRNSSGTLMLLLRRDVRARLCRIGAGGPRDYI